MNQLKFSTKAIEDLTSIYHYTAVTWSEEQAEYYYLMMIQACKSLVKDGTKGKIYSSILPDLFGYPCMKHIIFYRITIEKDIEIIRVLHEVMDIKNKF